MIALGLLAQILVVVISVALGFIIGQNWKDWR